jgi:hypothetical protein
MELDSLITSFVRLGLCFREAVAGDSSELTAGLIRLIRDHHQNNEWFTPEEVSSALSAFGQNLTEENLRKWVAMYPEINHTRPPSTIAVIMAGNIPMVGFHDLLSVLITGNRISARPSSKDSLLIREIASILTRIDKRFKEIIRITDDTIGKFDAIIATGSDNTSRYFEYYFGAYPNLIRKNRTGIALLTGTETEDQMRALGEDVFTYYGLGCRSVTKLYAPLNYDFTQLVKAWEGYVRLTANKKYANNYEYNRAVAIVNHVKFTDTPFVILREENSLFSPVGVVNYEYINSERFTEVINHNQNKIQVTVAGDCFTSFGQAQKPRLWDYSDNMDTIGFLLKNN